MSKLAKNNDSLNMSDLSGKESAFDTVDLNAHEKKFVKPKTDIDTTTVYSSVKKKPKFRLT
jgi:hypothetical protein